MPERSCPRPWCRSGYPEQRWPLDQAATVGRVTMGASLRYHSADVCVRQARAEEIRDAGLLEFPHDLLCHGFNLEEPRIGERLIEAVRTVVE
jgi:hypothetical protein